MPPVISRYSYLPENLLRYASAGACGAPFASPSMVIVGTIDHRSGRKLRLERVVLPFSVRETQAASDSYE